MANPVSFPFTTYQLANGTPVSNGYILVRLNTDGSASNVQIDSQAAKINLDSNGVIVGSQTFWPNVDISPSNTYYIVRVFTNQGELVLGPSSVTVAQSSSGFGSAFGSSFAS